MTSIDERTFIAIKPDGVQRGLIGEIIGRFERRGLKLIALKFCQLPLEVALSHYCEHEGKAFYDELVKYITSGPIVTMVFQGRNAVEIARKVIGATNPVNAEMGTIRGDFASEIGRNIVHGADSVDSAKREIALHFKPEELVPSWHHTGEQWIFGS